MRKDKKKFRVHVLCNLFLGVDDLLLMIAEPKRGGKKIAATKRLVKNLKGKLNEYLRRMKYLMETNEQNI